MTDLTLHQLGKEFLDRLHEWHAETGFLPFRQLVAAEDIRVDESREVADQYQRRQRRILLRSSQGERRKRFTGMHEVAHHVFKTDQDAMYYLALARLFPGNLEAQRKWEEVFVEQGGFQLLIPRPVFQQICEEYDEDAKRAQLLAIKAGCSLAAAGARIAYAFPRPIGGFVMDSLGNVTDFFVNDVDKYLRVGRNFVVPLDHPLRHLVGTPNEVQYLKAKIPYKHSQSKYSKHMQALYDEKRDQTVVFLNASHVRTRGQLRLFSDFA